jgi:hypothetical protein
MKSNDKKSLNSASDKRIILQVILIGDKNFNDDSKTNNGKSSNKLRHRILLFRRSHQINFETKEYKLRT